MQERPFEFVCVEFVLQVDVQSDYATVCVVGIEFVVSITV